MKEQSPDPESSRSTKCIELGSGFLQYDLLYIRQVLFHTILPLKDTARILLLEIRPCVDMNTEACSALLLSQRGEWGASVTRACIFLIN